MSKQKRKRDGGQKPSPPVPKPKWVPWIVGGVVVLAAIAVFAMFQPSPPPQSTSALSPDVPGSRVERRNEERLVGRWLRPDGGYVLEIRRAQADGRLDAAYLNPRPIHVARAEWRREGGDLRVFIELRDVNYPGSTYTLGFSPEQDRLVGAYFQAALQQTLEVEFVRQK